MLLLCCFCIAYCAESCCFFLSFWFSESCFVLISPILFRITSQIGPNNFSAMMRISVMGS